MRLILTCIIFLHISFFLKAQVYHFETGKVIPGDEPGLFDFKEGVFNSYPAEYSVLLAYENRNDRNSRLISIPVVRIKALSADSCKTPVFLLHGGPGESNLKKDFLYDDLIKNHDLILVGYRGVDGQVKLDCPGIQQAFLSIKRFSNSNTYFTDALNDCIYSLKDEGIDIDAYKIDDVVKDLYETKQAFGYDKISFLAFSFGTVVAQQFTQTFPEHTENLLLIGARPLNNLKISGDVFNQQFIKFVEYYLPDIKKNLGDSVTVLNFFKSKLEMLLKENEVMTQNGLSVFSFSQLYTLNVIESFMNVLSDTSNKSSELILTAYKEFYKKYPGDVILGDMYLKKQGRIMCDSLLDKGNSLGYMIAEELNSWYSPYHKVLCNNELNTIDTIQQKTLFISGELDVASPPDLLYQIQPYFKNSTVLNLQKTSHLDFFFEQKPVVDSLILNFYNN